MPHFTIQSIGRTIVNKLAVMERLNFHSRDNHPEVSSIDVAGIYVNVLSKVLII